MNRCIRRCPHGDSSPSPNLPIAIKGFATNRAAVNRCLCLRHSLYFEDSGLNFSACIQKKKDIAHRCPRLPFWSLIDGPSVCRVFPFLVPSCPLQELAAGLVRAPEFNVHWPTGLIKLPFMPCVFFRKTDLDTRDWVWRCSILVSADMFWMRDVRLNWHETKGEGRV